MGKTRRVRTKYHISSVKDSLNSSQNDSKFIVQDDSSDFKYSYTATLSNDISTELYDNADFGNNSLVAGEVDSIGNDASGEWKVVPEDDLFKNLDINIDNLEIIDNNAKPIVSISKCIKRSVAESGSNIQLKKEDKRELRKNLFIKKIDAIHQEVHKKKKKKSIAINTTSTNGNTPKWEIPYNNVNFVKTESKSPKVTNSAKKMTNSNTLKISKKKQKAVGKLKSRTQDMLTNIEFFNQIISDKKYNTDYMGVVTDAIQKRIYSDL